MSVADDINQNYDRNILLFILLATVAVLVLVAFLVLTVSVSPSWFVLPGSWWAGGMMVWAVSVWQRYRHSKKLSQNAR